MNTLASAHCNMLIITWQEGASTASGERHGRGIQQLFPANNPESKPQLQSASLLAQPPLI